VYVAASVLDANSSNELASSKDAFAEKIDATAREYEALDVSALLKELSEILGHYNLEESDLRLAGEPFFVIRSRAAHR